MNFSCRPQPNMSMHMLHLLRTYFRDVISAWPRVLHMGLPWLMSPIKGKWKGIISLYSHCKYTSLYMTKIASVWNRANGAGDDAVWVEIFTASQHLNESVWRISSRAFCLWCDPPRSWRAAVNLLDCRTLPPSWVLPLEMVEQKLCSFVLDSGTTVRRKMIQSGGGPSRTHPLSNLNKKACPICFISDNLVLLVESVMYLSHRQIILPDSPISAVTLKMSSSPLTHTQILWKVQKKKNMHVLPHRCSLTFHYIFTVCLTRDLK